MQQNWRRVHKKLNRDAGRLVARCGSAAHLVADTMLEAHDMKGNPGLVRQAYNTALEVESAVRSLVKRPLLSALTETRAAAATVRCRHCQPRQPLQLVSWNASGSNAEGLEDFIIGDGGTSDFDMMLEFDGPFRWTTPRVEPADIDPQSAPQLWGRPTSNAGFVTLHWVRTDRCGHEEPLEALPGDFVRRLMEDYCRAGYPDEVTSTGPAINVKGSARKDGGVDLVFCLFVRGWWPEPNWPAGAPRETNFPSAAARDEIPRFGVHLVPTGRWDSETKNIEYRISLSRAELLAVRQLPHVLRAAVKTLKTVKNVLKESGLAIVGLKSYFIKTAALWLAQEPHGGPWTGVTDGVHRLLDWLERRLAEGWLPCFFYPDIDVAAELTAEQRQAIIGSLRLVREHSTLLMMACCEKLFNLSALLEDGTEPLSERQLRLHLARMLIRLAVSFGIRYRPKAPCWQFWWSWSIPRLARAAPYLLQWLHHQMSAPHQQQCYLLMAWSVVDPADLADSEPMTPQVGNTITVDVTPLTRLLTESDLELLLGDPRGVTTWWGRQLHRPLAERPAGLTAELDTPRGRAELLLRPGLLTRAISEGAPREISWQRELDWRVCKRWAVNFRPLNTYQWCREELERDLGRDLQHSIRVNLPEMDGPTVVATAGLWRRRTQQLLSGDRLRAAYDAAVSRWPDRWQLLQYYLAEDKTDSQDSTRGDRDGEVEDVKQHRDKEEQTSAGLPHPHRQKWQLIEEQHQQRWKELELQHQQLWQELEYPGHEERMRMDKQHEEERRNLDRKHGEKWQDLGKRHYEERIELHQQHEEDTECLHVPTRGQPQLQRSVTKGQRKQQARRQRRQRRQWETMEQQHAAQWTDLGKKLRKQWNKMERRHQQESQELEKRLPSVRLEGELERMLEECSSRRQKLQVELQKELDGQLEERLEGQQEDA
ncbi:uncharacterized protein LOC122375343 [Amphibalanus amphitrite]|uniref:uncharacterized protein LOC122375343 n=1 Tax=Amphibalanus amphitrite TaxID=1232801 RepID=UPI001C90A7DB|nr:uncharacterized protein LOC122375343 [Amphibalanus amphitrite]